MEPKMTMRTDGARDALPLRLRMLCFCTLMYAAVFIAAMADLPSLPLTLLVCSPLLFLRKKALALTDRNIVYSTLLAVMTATVLGYMFPYQRGRLGVLSFFFRPEYYIGFLLNLSFVSLLFPSRDLAIGMTIASAIGVMGMCGDSFFTEHTNTRFAYFDSLFNSHLQILYIFSCLILAASSLLLLQMRRFGASQGRLLRACLWLMSLLVLCSVVSIGLVYRKSYQEAVGDLDTFFVDFALSPRRDFWRGGAFYGGNVDLRQPFPWYDRRNDAQILLRVKGKAAPGYMRSRELPTYVDGQWVQKENPMGVTLDFEEQEGLLAMTIYKRHEMEADSEKCWDVLYSNLLRCDQLPVPHAAARLDIAAENLDLDECGQFTTDRWKRDGGYRVWAAKDANGAFDLPALEDDEQRREQYLQIPDNIKARLAAAVRRVPGMADASDASIAAQCVMRYFEEGFKYGFPRNVVAPQNEDPVMYFLERTREGHCEFFASSAVLLLRSAGIPARYVTGFVCTERSPDGSYYVARKGHAHAWCEYYDASNGKWELLDATPPGGAPDYEGEWSFAQAQGDRLKYMIDRLMANVHRGELALVLIDGVKALLALLLTPAGILLILALAAWYLWRRRRLRRMPLVSLSASKKRQAAQMARFMAYWERKLHLRRDASRTPRELIDAMSKANIPQEELRQATEQVENYERARFGKEE